MLNLTPHRRLHIPHGLAIFAAVLLIGSSVAGPHSNQNKLTSADQHEITVAAKNMRNDINVIRDAVNQEPHVLKLGLQLFQR